MISEQISNAFPSQTVAQLKQQAKRLRSSLEADGVVVTHSQSLELLARQLGHRDWNTAHAAAGNTKPACPVGLGQTVEGRYLSRNFKGEVIGIKAIAPSRFRVTFNFDEPVDVVTFDSFSAFRKRVTCTIDGRGKTTEKTSDGLPHMELRLPPL